MDVFDRPLRQPDPRSCGAATLVVARMLHDPAYAARATPRFGEASTAMHRRVTGPCDVDGRLQLPWPRSFGTPPWAVARQLAWTFGVPYRTYLVPPGRRAAILREALTAVASGLPVALYVGSRWLPRHVVLLVDGGAGTGPTAYEPGSGRLVRFSPQEFADGALSLGGWERPWFVVSPGDHLPTDPRSR